MGNFRLTSHRELTRLLSEIVITNTSKINKLTKDSFSLAIIQGCAKVAQKALSDMNISLSRLFPSTASDEDLDSAARLAGVSARKNALGSSTFVQVFADPGTVYSIGQSFSSVIGIDYESTSDKTIDDTGIGYIPVRSVSVGINTNSEAFEINIANNPPTGHIVVTNPIASIGGRDIETDEELRERINLGCTIAEVGTLEKYAAAFALVNSNVLRVLPYGRTSGGKIRLGVASVNGAEFTQSEFDDILSISAKYFSISDITPVGSDQFNIELVNIEYQFIDLDFRAQLDGSRDFVDIIREMQVALNRVVDYRYWRPGIDFVQWEDLLNAVRGIRGVISAPDRVFSPRIDIQVGRNVLPRFRGFILRNLDGEVLVDNTTVLDTFYPNENTIEVDSIL